MAWAVSRTTGRLRPCGRSRIRRVSSTPSTVLPQPRVTQRDVHEHRRHRTFGYHPQDLVAVIRPHDLEVADGGQNRLHQHGVGRIVLHHEHEIWQRSSCHDFTRNFGFRISDFGISITAFLLREDDHVLMRVPPPPDVPSLGILRSPFVDTSGVFRSQTSPRGALTGNAAERIGISTKERPRRRFVVRPSRLHAQAGRLRHKQATCGRGVRLRRDKPLLSGSACGYVPRAAEVPFSILLDAWRFTPAR